MFLVISLFLFQVSEIKLDMKKSDPDFPSRYKKKPVDKDVYSRNRKQESENDKYLGI